MQEGQFVKVFDVLQSGYKDWQFPAFGLIFIFIGMVLVFAPRLIAATGIPYMDFKSKMSRAFRFFFLGFAVLWTVAAFLGTFTDYERHKALALNNTCRIVEGPVENFVPMPYTGHADESFTVSGIPFKYSDYSVTDAFNQTLSHGGPIDRDIYVRICYDPKGNAILRLEIRNFSGPVKRYTEPNSPFSQSTQESHGTLNVPGNMAAVNPLPWYSSLFFWLYLVDIAATQSLYLPYIRTFFRISRAPVDSQEIPRSLLTNIKVRLRNSTVYWDRANQAMWLLPRGFNRLRLMSVVAKLNTDIANTTITSSEIYFSSGVPIILALFFWTAYLLFSQTMPTDGPGPSAGEFVGMVVILATIGGFIQIRMDRARMVLLVQDALQDLRGIG